MLEIIRNFFTADDVQAGDADWLRDPLSHPVLDRMTPNELADLPLSLPRLADNQNGPFGEGEKLCA